MGTYINLQIWGLLHFAWVGSSEMAVGIPVWNHDAGPRGTVQTPV